MEPRSNASSNSPQPDLPAQSLSQSPSHLPANPPSNFKINCIASQTHSSIPWIIAFVFVGCLLRLVWAEDMKWKADEIWMYETARDVVTGKQPWPWLGMANGVGFLNPGLSVWCFIALAWVTDDPVSMVRWVQGSNIVAIGLFIGFIVRFIPQSEQLIWLWGLAILSVNPLAIHFSRAIWSVDILLFFAFFVFVGHWFRQFRSGAFVWGLLGTLIGQIHMSGFFWQASLVLVSFWQQFKSKSKYQPQHSPHHSIEHSTQYSKQHPTQWIPWALGSAIGLLPMIPWIRQIGGTAATIARPSWAELLTPNFPLHWLLSSWGLNLEYDLGPEFWRSFLLEPRIMGYPSLGVAVALLFLAVSAIAAIVRWWHRWQHQRQSLQQHLNDSIAERKSDLKLEPVPNAYLPYLWAGGVVMPILLLLARVRIPGHYLIVLYPFIHIWVAVLERSRVRSLIMICSAQLFLSMCFLLFIHIHNGGPEAFYGTVYRLQQSR